jgi:hypothetical protein
VPELFALLPALQRVSHPLLEGRRIIAVGVSAVLYDERAFAFEVTHPRHWGRRADGTRIVGIGGIGGRIEPGDSPLASLARQVREEIGVGFWPEPPGATALIHDGAMAGWLDVPAGPGRAAPYMVNLLPPQLERLDRPDHLAIVSFRGILRREPQRGNLFGLLRIERPAVERFFEQREWPLQQAQALPGLSFDLALELPAGSLLRPTLTGRAFQVLLAHRSGL